MPNLTIHLIKDLHHEIKQAVNGNRKEASKIKNFTQMQILFYIAQNSNKVIYQKDIGEALKLKKSSITEHLDYLELIGAIVRTPDDKDKRKNSITLSNKSKEKIHEIDEIIVDVNNKAIKGIAKKDLELFEKVVKKMEDNLRQDEVNI